MNDERTKKRGEMLARRRKVASLYLRRVNETDIAERLKVSQATVSRDVKWLMQQWREAAVADIAEARGRELAELDEMEHDAALQFVTTKSPQWFTARLECKKRRAKMLNLDVPPTARQIEIDVRTLTDEQLDRIAAGEDPLAVLAGTGNKRTSETGEKTATSEPADGKPTSEIAIPGVDAGTPLDSGQSTG